MFKKTFIFEGEVAEKYKLERNKWIRLAIASTGFPFFLAILISLFKGSFNFLDLISNGEIILSLLALSLPLVFDIFSINKKEDNCLQTAFFLCIMIICCQVALYCLIRMSQSNFKTVSSIIASIAICVGSWICCIYSIKAKFNHINNIEE